MSDPIEDYIQTYREKYPREALTKRMIADGHDPTAIAAWSRLTPDQVQAPIVVRREAEVDCQPLLARVHRGSRGRVTRDKTQTDAVPANPIS